MNSPLVVEQARNLVDQPGFKSLANDEERVTLLYELVFQREAKPVEIKLGLNFVVNQAPLPSNLRPPPNSFSKGWTHAGSPGGQPSLNL